MFNRIKGSYKDEIHISILSFSLSHTSTTLERDWPTMISLSSSGIEYILGILLEFIN